MKESNKRNDDVPDPCYNFFIASVYTDAYIGEEKMICTGGERMLSTRDRRILQLLSKTEYTTAASLAEELGISVKTVRTRIKEMNPEIRKSGVEILSKPRYGYYIVSDTAGGMERLLEEHGGEEKKIPETGAERVNYLLAYLLNQKEYVKAESLCEFLYISRGTLTAALREVEKIYQQYGLALKKKPGYGMKVDGTEFQIRQCMMELFVKHEGLEGIGSTRRADKIRLLGQLVYECVRSYEVKLSESGYHDFVEHLYVALRRIQRGCLVEGQEVDFLGSREIGFAEELSKRIEETMGIRIPGCERTYFALQLAGKSGISVSDSETDCAEKDTMNSEKDSKKDIEKDREMDRLIGQILDMVYQEFGVDLRKNQDLRRALSRHMVPFAIRMRYQIGLHNPMLEEIKEHYIFAYTIASQASGILREYFQTEISDDEIGELAEIFELALEQREAAKRKFSILIVCASGMSSSQLLKYKYSREFGENINQIYVCNRYELAGFDFAKVDYVFTTVPLDTPVPVPVLEVSSFLKEGDVTAVRELFERESRDCLDEYYQRELFFTDIVGDTREEVLKNLCEAVRQKRGLPEDFYESVIRREQISPTDYGGFVAIPHPDRVYSAWTFAAVAVLQTSVLWSRNEVQIVILTVVGSEEDPKLEKFYEATTDLILRPADIRYLVEHPEYDTFLRMLRK